MIVLVMAISNLKLTQQIYSEETNGSHAHNRDRVPLKPFSSPEPLGLICNRPVALDATENTNFFIGWRQLNAQSK